MKQILAAALLVTTLSSCHVVRFFTLNFADIKDYKRFAKVEVKKGDNHFRFHSANTSQVKLPATLPYKDNHYDFEQFLEKSQTVAFLIIRNDTLLYEQYPNGYNQASVVPSFSVAKSFVSALIGIAIDEGYIKSVHDPITDYLPELDKKEFGHITIEHLLDMRSGVRFNEGYFNPFGDVAKYYYGTNIRKYIRKLKVAGPPGQEFEYRSVNSQLLALIVSNATGRPVSQYLQEKIWSKLDMEYDASWSLDSRRHKTEKAFCCLNARARDYARLGRLYLNEGNWNGEQIVSREWVRRSVQFDQPKNGFAYSYQWWHNRQLHEPADSMKINGLKQLVTLKDRKGRVTGTALATPLDDFIARGILGQFIYVLPKKNIIIVRLGKDRKHVAWEPLMREIALMN
jgi:CubicO group peptidase (beta-lactamase class C family)